MPRQFGAKIAVKSGCPRKMVSQHLQPQRKLLVCLPSNVRCNAVKISWRLVLEYPGVSVGKALARLQQDELIELGYGKIVIPNTKRLKQWLQERTLLAPLQKQH